MTSQAIDNIARLSLQSPGPGREACHRQSPRALPDAFDASNESLHRVELAGIAGLSAPGTERSRYGSKLPFSTNQPGKKFVYTDIPDTARAVHQNLSGYLKRAWSEHFGVALTPDMLWQHMQSEVARAVGRDPDVFRTLFSTSQQQQTVQVVHDSDLSSLLDSLASAVSLRLPDPGFAKDFTPVFSTSNKRSHTATQAALLGSLSSYYRYQGTMCGIPYVQVFGDASDWRLFSRSAEKLSARFSSLAGATDAKGEPRAEVVAGYLRRVSSLASRLENPEQFSGRNMFALNCCHSGMHEPYGWIFEAYMDATETTVRPYEDSHLAGAFHKEERTFRPVITTEGWHSHTPESGVSLLRYTRLFGNNQDVNLEIRSGLFYSHAVPQAAHPRHPLLQPQFGTMVFQDLAPDAAFEDGANAEGDTDQGDSDYDD